MMKNSSNNKRAFLKQFLALGAAAATGGLGILGGIATARAADTPKPVELLNVSYDPTRELYAQYNPIFAKYWKAKTGQDVIVKNSHGGSGAQARTVIKTFAAKMVGHPNVLDVFFVGGQDDFLVRVVTTSPEQLRDFVAGPLSSDPVVASTHTQIVFDHLRGLDHWADADGFDELRGPLG